MYIPFLLKALYIIKLFFLLNKLTDLMVIKIANSSRK